MYKMRMQEKENKMKESLIKAISKGLLKAMKEFAKNPSDFNGELSVEDLVAFINDSILNTCSTQPGNYSMLVEHLQKMIDWAIALSGDKPLTTLKRDIAQAEAAIAAMGDASIRKDEAISGAVANTATIPPPKEPHPKFCIAHNNYIGNGTVCGVCSEISGNEDIHSAIRNALRLPLGSYRIGDVIASPFLYGEAKVLEDNAVAVYNAIRPYLRTTEPGFLEKVAKRKTELLHEMNERTKKPVTVSLEKCSQALDDYIRPYIDADQPETALEGYGAVKAVFDAAEVKYGA